MPSNEPSRAGYLGLHDLNALQKLFDEMAAARRLQPRTVAYENLAQKVTKLYLAGVRDPAEIARRIEAQAPLQRGL